MTALLYSPAELLARLLIAERQGGDPLGMPLPPWPVYINNEPAFPECTITVVDQNPQTDARDMGSGESALHYGFEIRVRGSNQEQVYPRAEALRYWLETALQNLTVSTPGANYLIPCASHLVMRGMGKDTPGSKRIRYAITGLIVISSCP